MEIDNTREIAEAIFTKPPGEPNTIDLSLEDETADIARQSNIDYFIFNILRLITLHGVKILFGHQNIMDLTEDQVFLIKRYTRSYGYNLKVKNINNLISISFERI